MWVLASIYSMIVRHPVSFSSGEWTLRNQYLRFMDKNGPIILIDDDEDDLYFVRVAFQQLSLPNDIISFSDPQMALGYMLKEETDPFLIFCDINMPRVNGIQLRKLFFANQTIREKCVPFLFLSTSYNKNHVFENYQQYSQGYFIKPSLIAELTVKLSDIVKYWMIAANG